VDRLEEMMVKTQMVVQSLAIEMKLFRDEMKIFKDEMKRDTKNLKQELAGISKKMGTIVEDIVAPNINYTGKKYFNCSDCLLFMVRVKVKHSKIKGTNTEFDIISVYSDKVIINETKSTPRPEDPRNFSEKINDFFNYFPEYEGKKIIPLFASIHIPENILSDLSRHKIYAMGMKEGTMDILNKEILENKLY
jgi:hypothetical protein